MDINESSLQQVGLNRDSLGASVAVVTGAGRGIGRAVAVLFSSLGARVVVAELDEMSGRAVEREIRDSGGEALFVRTDVADSQSVADLAAVVAKAYGPADILINNAILCPVCSVLDIDPGLWDRVMAVNVRGALLTCKAFLPAMLERGQGTIVNMVSADAMAFMSAYIASKQALAAFSQSLSAEVAGRGVRVIALAPGFVDTPGLREAGRQLGPRMGMTEDQFIGLSLHPAYSGMMPVGDAALATAYLIAHLADEYAGEVVTGYRILERAGYIAAEAASPAGGESSAPNSIASATGSRQTGHGEALAEARSLIVELRQALVETESEFGRLPVFVRPLARGGFKGKAGQSLAEWLSMVGRLEQQLSTPTGVKTAVTDLPRLRGLIDKLVTYYEGVPAETARFSKDRDFLEATAQTCERRIMAARDLVRALEGMV